MTNAASSGGDSKMLTGLFRDSESVERAYQAVAQRGYDIGDVNLVMSDDTRRRYFSGDQNTELGSKAAEGSELGGPIGGTIGTIIPVLVAAGGFVAFPGLGLVIAGPVAAAVAGGGGPGFGVWLCG